MAIENTVSIDFDARLTIVDGVFDCRLTGVLKDGVHPGLYFIGLLVKKLKIACVNCI